MPSLEVKKLDDAECRLDHFERLLHSLCRLGGEVDNRHPAGVSAGSLIGGNGDKCPRGQLRAPQRQEVLSLLRFLNEDGFVVLVDHFHPHAVLDVAGFIDLDAVDVEAEKENVARPILGVRREPRLVRRR